MSATLPYIQVSESKGCDTTNLYIIYLCGATFALSKQLYLVYLRMSARGEGVQI
jgi:hypothetical protein